MAYKYYNPNPKNKRVGDCTVRAICKALGRTWEDAYIGLCAEGLCFHDMPSSNHVWGNYLRRFGFEQKGAGTCPDCVTIKEFTEGHRHGRFVIASQGHIVTAIDGDYFDTWDSGDEILIFYWEKET